MKSVVWTKAMRECADPHRARHFFQLLAATNAGPALQECSIEQARVLAALFSGSRVGANLLVSHPEWLGALDAEALKFPRRKQGFAQEVEGWLGPLLGGRDYSAALARSREFKQRELLRIAARDLGRPGNASEITREISDLADVVLDSVWRICWSQLTQRHGRPWHKDASGRWQPTAGSIIGLGKLGGQELNYSSDVDVIFVYSEEGNVFRQRPGAGSVKSAGADGSLTNHQFFNRLAEAFIAEVT